MPSVTHHEMSPTTGTTAALWPPSLPSAGVWGAVVLGSRLGGVSAQMPRDWILELLGE